MVFAGGLGEHAGGDEAEVFEGFFVGFDVVFVLFDEREAHAVGEDAVLGGFGGDDGDDFDAVAGVE